MVQEQTVENEVQEEIESLEETEGVTMCGANFQTTVEDETQYTNEISFKIGGRKYIENAP